MIVFQLLVSLIQVAQCNQVLINNNLPFTLVDRKLYGFGENQPTQCTMVTKVKLTIDDVEEKVDVLIVPNDAQAMDLIVGRIFTELPNIAYVHVGCKLHLGYKNEYPFRDLKWKQDSQKIPVRVQNTRNYRKMGLTLLR